MKPSISVVMSVYNGERFLREAIESILSQSFKDFEFIIIDDGAKDKSLDIIKRYSDPRIVVVTRENRGLVASLNEGFSLAKGEYIARMDADDVSEPRRLEIQKKYLDSRPGVAVVSSFADVIGSSGEIVNELVFPFKAKDLTRRLLLGNTLVHGSCLIRASTLKEFQTPYREQFNHIEDYDLWVRLVERGFKIGCVPQKLYLYRVHSNSVSARNSSEQMELAKEIQARLWDKNFVPKANIVDLFFSSITYLYRGNRIFHRFVSDQMELCVTFTKGGKAPFMLLIFSLIARPSSILFFKQKFRGNK